MEKVVLNDKFDLFSEHWSPKIVGQVNDCDVKLAKLLGTPTNPHLRDLAAPSQAADGPGA